jgi:hypothetical protein
MNFTGTATRIGAFAALLALVFAAASFAGSRIDPSVDEPESHDEDGAGETAAGHAEGSPPGLAVSEGGYTLVADQASLAAGRAAELSFRIEDDDGETVEGFDVEHERRMHLIVVRRDFEGFQHLHPEQADDGSWSVEVGALEPGAYRVFADFSTGGDSLTLGTDLSVPGDFHPESLPGVSPVADAGDGYEVRIDSAKAAGGSTVLAEFTVSRNGREVGGVQPYLGADGHLVALREGDLACLHTHPEGEAGGPGPIGFEVEYPSAGRYRLFLQFRHRGQVRTAEFTRVAGEGVAPAAGPAAGHEDEGEGGH